mmetsp:Transcript_28057/g.24787  ORF Transcript_28057/g.24787 Transcript_28057/m.24787 type:complete len:150 (-) Transcript_28057:24-473(-)
MEFKMKENELNFRLTRSTESFEKMINEEFTLKDPLNSVTFPIESNNSNMIINVLSTNEEEKTEKVLKSPHILSALRTIGFDHKDLDLDALKHEQVLDFFLELSNQIREIVNNRKIPRRSCQQCIVLKEQMKRLVRILSKIPGKDNTNDI